MEIACLLLTIIVVLRFTEILRLRYELAKFKEKNKYLICMLAKENGIPVEYFSADNAIAAYKEHESL